MDFPSRTPNPINEIDLIAAALGKKPIKVLGH